MGEKQHLDQDLKETLREFKRKSGISKVIVFGSTARGETTKHSDVDLVLVDNRFEGKDFFERPKGLYKHWGSRHPVDFLCYTPKEFEKLKNQITIVRQATKTGIPIKT